jgi:hypothetical protein
MVGQPAGDGEGGHGGAVGSLHNLPGDRGDVDFGPDSNGAFTSNPLTEEPGDALDSLGGSGLSVTDARRDDDDDEDDDEDTDDGAS